MTTEMQRAAVAPIEGDVLAIDGGADERVLRDAPGVGALGCARSFEGAGASEGLAIAAAEADMERDFDEHFGRGN